MKLRRFWLLHSCSVSDSCTRTRTELCAACHARIELRLSITITLWFRSAVQQWNTCWWRLRFHCCRRPLWEDVFFGFVRAFVAPEFCYRWLNCGIVRFGVGPRWYIMSLYFLTFCFYKAEHCQIDERQTTTTNKIIQSENMLRKYIIIT